MPVVRLVCWKVELAEERRRTLQDKGIAVDASPLRPQGLIAQFRECPPIAVLIDLDRLPSHGREVAVALRNSKATRHIPIVFAGGAGGKVRPIREELPDACFTEWSDVAAALTKAIAETPAEPLKPVSHMDRFAGTPLVKKLGLKNGMKVALLGAPPEGFQDELGELPEAVDLSRRMSAGTGLALWFVRSRRELESAVEAASATLPPGSSVWIVHPKQSGRYKPDFNQNDVREAGLAVELVDYKVCAVNTDWSALKFARRSHASR